MLKQQKGITLVALVVTIVILIILAGVAISMTLSEHGLFNRAKEAANSYSNAEAKESELVNGLDTEVNTILTNN